MDGRFAKQKRKLVFVMFGHTEMKRIFSTESILGELELVNVLGCLEDVFSSFYLDLVMLL